MRLENELSQTQGRVVQLKSKTTPSAKYGAEATKKASLQAGTVKNAVVPKILDVMNGLIGIGGHDGNNRINKVLRPPLQSGEIDDKFEPGEGHRGSHKRVIR
ncbi:hypothetical protein B0H10DRAFT_2231826 [Mycena sp. CBHHK59/15]|nr:hypothetical protein B0H10DRAFT_2231826 [Mycena sp. CBHHK59/15]